MTACHDTSSWETNTLPPLTFRHIVVGIDGSPNSIEALRVAARLGARDGARIEAVCVYRSPLYTPYPLTPVVVPPYGPAGEGSREGYATVDDLLDERSEALNTLEHAAREAFAGQVVENVVLRPVEGRESSVHDVLTRMSTGTDLLVVGARGHSGPLGLLLGSTAHACVRHARTAVLVVPAAHGVPAEAQHKHEQELTTTH
jgi:nucleotide-binding universal stress UspA family protein